MAVTVALNPNESIEKAPHKYYGLAGDTKPTVASHGSLPEPSPGSIYWAYDTDALYVTQDGTNWNVYAGGGISAAQLASILGSQWAVLAAVTTATDTTHFKSTDLIGYGGAYFKNWEVYPVWDAVGAGGAPQNEHKPISAFVSTDGTVTHTAFTAQLALTDKVLLMHPWAVALVDWLDGGRLDLLLDLIKSVTDYMYLAADGTGVYPASIVQDSALAKILSKADPAVTTSYDNTTDSLEAAADREIAIKTQTDKLAGATPTASSTTANWNTATGTSGEAGEDLVTIGANDTKNKVLSLMLDVSACLDGSVLTVKLFSQINGTERKVYSEGFVVNTDPDGLWIIAGVVGIHEALRVEVYSSTSESVAIGYDYMLEVM